jgi:hypothetical protein
MQVFTFQSDRDADVFGFTTDQAGANLPSEFAPWRYTGGSAVPIGSRLGGLGISGELMGQVATAGFYVARLGQTGINMDGGARRS